MGQRHMALMGEVQGHPYFKFIFQKGVQLGHLLLLNINIYEVKPSCAIRLNIEGH